MVSHFGVTYGIYYSFNGSVLDDGFNVVEVSMKELITIDENPICSKGVDKRTCMNYKIGKCCDYKKSEEEKK